MVKNGNLDIAIIYANENDPKLEGLKVYNLKKLHYCLIGNNKYKKYCNKKISFSEIKNENLILNSIKNSFLFRFNNFGKLIQKMYR